MNPADKLPAPPSGRAPERRSNKAPDRPYRIASSPSYLARAIAARSFVNLKRAMQPHDLTPTAWRVLASLHERDGRNIAELAEHTATDRSNLGRAIGAMDKEGLVERRPAPKDRRNTLIFLTAPGRRKYDAVVPIVRSVADQLLAGMTAAEADQAVALLQRMLANAHRPSRD